MSKLVIALLPFTLVAVTSHADSYLEMSREDYLKQRELESSIAFIYCKQTEGENLADLMIRSDGTEPGWGSTTHIELRVNQARAYGEAGTLYYKRSQVTNGGKSKYVYAHGLAYSPAGPFFDREEYFGPFALKNASIDVRINLDNNQVVTRATAGERTYEFNDCKMTFSYRWAIVRKSDFSQMDKELYLIGNALAGDFRDVNFLIRSINYEIFQHDRSKVLLSAFERLKVEEDKYRYSSLVSSILFSKLSDDQALALFQEMAKQDPHIKTGLKQELESLNKFCSENTDYDCVRNLDLFVAGLALE